MDTVISSLEEGLNGLVESISRYEDVHSQVHKIVKLDRAFVTEVEHLKNQYEATRRIEALQDESSVLDNEINNTLLQLSDCRKELEIVPKLPDSQQAKPVNAEALLDYAIKITKFTRRMPGMESLVPWPTEDNLRQGMLAALAIQDPEAMQIDAEQDSTQNAKIDTEEHSHQHAHPGAAPRRGATKPRKISLDFDSDEE